ncbi:hypothetical protein [Nostoc sp. TCL240-02]|uniref:hypothetical protein n=1 Tax=Nostoc sp. TCL240-02 TaxID=2572090 RepID=UPI00157F9CA8|nr:hypothetical protein [Nostoc sp. TCL240-02]QKQ76840.1 hypothetical protein FBB35_29230 [Nostoc sp. TCL240-02]
MGIGNWELVLSEVVRLASRREVLGIENWAFAKDKGQLTNDKPERKQKLQVFFQSVTFIYTNNRSQHNSALQLSYEFGCFSPSIPFYPPNTAGN